MSMQRYEVPIRKRLVVYTVVLLLGSGIMYLKDPSLWYVAGAASLVGLALGARAVL